MVTEAWKYEPDFVVNKINVKWTDGGWRWPIKQRMASGDMRREAFLLRSWLSTFSGSYIQRSCCMVREHSKSIDRRVNVLVMEFV